MGEGVEIVTINGHQNLAVDDVPVHRGEAPGEDGGFLYYRELPGDAG